LIQFARAVKFLEYSFGLAILKKEGVMLKKEDAIISSSQSQRGFSQDPVGFLFSFIGY